MLFLICLYRGVFITSKTGNLTLGNEVSVRHHGEYQCTLQAPCFQLFSDIGHITVTGKKKRSVYSYFVYLEMFEGPSADINLSIQY